jgi:hypothetical protein
MDKREQECGEVDQAVLSARLPGAGSGNAFGENPELSI